MKKKIKKVKPVKPKRRKQMAKRKDEVEKEPEVKAEEPKNENVIRVNSGHINIEQK